MKKLFLGVLVVIVGLGVLGSIDGVQQAGQLKHGSPQLSAFKNVVACESGMTIGELVETYSIPNTHEWQDGKAERYGNIVGFLAEFDAGDAPVKLGMQSQYQESGMQAGVFKFQPVALEMFKASTGANHSFPPSIITPMLKELCAAIVAKAEAKP